jgi:hypothetical protein
MQTEKYFKGMEDEVKTWFKIKQDKIDKLNDDICIIHVRGGDFLYSTAFLPREYYISAINNMNDLVNNLKYYIVTDDWTYAKRILPEIQIVGGAYDVRDVSQASHHNGGSVWKDYAILNTAKYIIMSASSFAWWATWTNKNVRKVIAPKYWAAYKQSDGFWSTGDSVVKGWYWLDKEGILETI